MSCARKMLSLAALLITATVVAGPETAVAQKSAGGVVGEARLHPGTWSNQRTSRSIRHARSYARGIYRYSRDASGVQPAVARSESEELGRNIAKAQNELATARKDAGNDAKTLTALKSIEQHLSTAAAHHKKLHEECSKEFVDGMVCMECCNNILLELDKAQAEQDALIRSMEMGTPSSGAAPATHEHQ